MTDTTFELYGWNTPNGQKIVIALEEIGQPYLYHPIDITVGAQREEWFVRISPDGKIPALRHNVDTPFTLFESGAILLYLADLFPIIGGTTAQEKSRISSWTFWQVGQLGPLAGQFGRFQNAEPENPAAVAHFEALVWRCLNVLDKQLQQSKYLAGDKFTVADIASFPWVASKQSYLQRYSIDWRQQCPALNTWVNDIMSRPSVINALGLA